MNVHAMRKLFVVMAVLAVVGIVPAFAQAANITITKSGFVPSSVTIHPGESITWTNSDTVAHQVSSTKATLSSPVMNAAQTYSFMLETAVGAQTVCFAPAAAAMCSNGSFGPSGIVWNQPANQAVTIRAQSYGTT